MPLPRGAYNLDSLGADAFGDGVVSQPPVAKPKRDPPARFANKAKPSTVASEDQPIKPAANLDDMPIGGAKRPLPAEEQTPNDEEKPLPRGAYNLDDLGEDAFGGPPPPKKPAGPPRLTNKPKPDEEMKDETAPKPPPARVPAKPKEEEKKVSKPAAQTAGGPKAPNVQDEDVGAGLSKEEAEAKVAETFSPEAFSLLADDKKWNEKVEGFKMIGQAISELKPDSVTLEAVVRFTKTKLKDWKESNINLIKEAINLFTTIATSTDTLSKRSAFIMMPFLADKLGDVKTLALVSELLVSLSECVTPKFVALQLIKYGTQAKAPNAIKETCNSLTRLTDEFGMLCLPLKEQIDFAILSVNNSNPQVRQSAMALLAEIYRHAGDGVRNFVKDVKESTMKLVDEEFKKVTPYARGEYVRKRGFKGEAAATEEKQGAGKKAGAAGGGGGGLDDLLPRADISKLLTPKLMPLFKDNDWKKRKEAADKVEEILRGANMRIQPVGLGEVMDNVKQRMTDPNKAVVKAYMQLICLLVEALGANARQFAKKILPPMMQNLADKQSLVRGDAVTAMDKWAKECGAELIITIGGPMVSQDNPELRTEMLNWIIKNKDSIKLMTPDAQKDLCKPLVECLSDKTPALRASAEEVICQVMPFTGYAAFQGILANLKPAVQQSIKPVLEKVKNKVGCSVVAAPTAE